MIDASSLEAFAAAPNHPELKVKHVWKLENQELKYIPLKNTSFFEIIQAWFGYGPLSLANIAEFISAHSQEIINKGLFSYQKAIIFKKFQSCCHSFNANHSIRKVSAVAYQQLRVTSAPFFSLFYKDATYQTDGKGIDDFSYSDNLLGFGYVADGTGHNNPMMAQALKKIFTQFNDHYASARAKATLNSLEDYRKLVKEELTRLGDAIHTSQDKVLDDPKKPGMTHMCDGTLKPAFSFVQIAEQENTRFLITAQFSDTMLLIHKADGSFDTSLAPKRVEYAIGERHPIGGDPFQVIEVHPGDIVYGFSDGIGEFLTMKECQEVIVANRNPEMLLRELKEKIIENGKNFVQDPKDRYREKPTPSANGQKSTKFHLPDDRHFHDDISMFSLGVN